MVKEVALDINDISDAALDEVLEEFREQHGDAEYDDWVITATKVNREDI